MKKESVKYIIPIVVYAIFTVAYVISAIIQNNRINYFRDRYDVAVKESIAKEKSWQAQHDSIEKEAADRVKFCQDQHDAFIKQVNPTIGALKVRIELLEQDNAALKEKTVALSKEVDSLKNNPSVVTNKELSTTIAGITQSSQKISEQSDKITTGISKAKEDLKKIDYLISLDGNYITTEDGQRMTVE